MVMKMIATNSKLLFNFFTFVILLQGEGNGTPLQYSCLGNPMDGGPWWAAVHGVAKSQTHWVTSLSLFTFMHWRRKWQHTPIFLPGESQGREPDGLPSMGSHRVRHDWRDLAAAASSETWSWRAWVQSHLLSEPRVTDLLPSIGPVASSLSAFVSPSGRELWMQWANSRPSTMILLIASPRALSLDHLFSLGHEPSLSLLAEQSGKPILS